MRSSRPWLIIREQMSPEVLALPLSPRSPSSRGEELLSMAPGQARQARHHALALLVLLLRRRGTASLKEGACFDSETGLPFGFLLSGIKLTVSSTPRGAGTRAASRRPESRRAAPSAWAALVGRDSSSRSPPAKHSHIVNESVGAAWKRRWVWKGKALVYKRSFARSY